MNGTEGDAAVEGGSVERVVLVDRITRRRRGFYQATTLPGHLVQLTTSGEAVHESAGRVFRVGRGLVVWFHQDEEVRIRLTRAPWTFFTVNFIAPGLPLPPFDRRVREASPQTEGLFRRLLEAWRDRSAEALVRHLRVKARLLDLLADILPSESAPLRVDPFAQVWWDLESKLRQRLHERINLDLLCRTSGRSLRTLCRACHRATGTAPMKRIKRIRLSMARGLVLHSSLNISEVAYRVGYDRVQELCRDYRRHLGVTPLEDRAAGPDYRRVRTRCGANEPGSVTYFY